MRPIFPTILLPTLLAGFSPSLTAAGKPNTMFLFADDPAYEAIREFGHTDIDTPDLDRLVKRGTTLSRAYNPGS